MRASDIAKLAASVVAGYISEEAAYALVSEDGDVLLLGRLIEGDPSATKHIANEISTVGIPKFLNDPAGNVLDRF